MKDLLSFLIKETEIKKYKKTTTRHPCASLIFEAVELLTPLHYRSHYR
jgi:hypothetical protein